MTSLRSGSINRLKDFIYSHWKLLWGLCLGLCFGMLVIHPIAENDPYGQMALGRAVLEQGTRVVAELYAIKEFDPCCVAPEWMWGVLLYKLYQSGSWPAVIAFVLVLAILFAIVVVYLIFEFTKRKRGGCIQSTLLVSLLIVALSLARIRVRPQTVFFLSVSLFLLIGVFYADAVGRKRLGLSVLLVLLEIVWAQFHGSFVIAPVLFLILVTPKWKNYAEPHLRTTDLAVLLFLIIGCFTSAHSFDLVNYIFSHSSGDATFYNEEMQPTRLIHLSTNRTPFGVLYLSILFLTIAGLLYGRNFFLREFLLGSFGMILSVTAVRFLAVGGLLWGPLCAMACCEFFNSRNRRFYATVVIFILLPVCSIAVANHVDRKRGPLFHIDNSLEKHPHAAVAYFKMHSPSKPINVLTDYNAGTVLGFELNGKVRTFVDSRTPLYFDDTDYAVARDIWSRPEGLRNGIEHFNFEAAVVSRYGTTCRMLNALGWAPVVVESQYTTFVKSPDEGQYTIESLNPCGDMFFKATTCAEDGGQMQADVQYLERFKNTPFLNFLKAFQSFECKKDVESAERILPEKFQSRAFTSEYARLRARMLFVKGRIDEALEVLEPRLEAGDMQSWDLLERGIAKGVISPFRAEPLYAKAEREMKDRMPVRLRVMHASLCTELQIPECVRFEAIRSAAMGEHRVIPSLIWLSQHHPIPRVRKNALDWALQLEKQQFATNVKAR